MASGRVEENVIDVGRFQLPAVIVALVAGLGASLVGEPVAANVAYGVATAVALVPALVASARSVIARQPGVDIIAVLAMAGALLLGEFLAGAIIAVMLAGGEALEDHAAGRARRELTDLLSRAPRAAHASDEAGGLRDIPIEEVAVGDRLLVKAGEVVPTDGLLLSDRAVLDESALSGEARPVEVDAGRLVRSGVVNAAGPMLIRATTSAAASTYAGIVRLVEQAATERPPFVRLADRYATWFVGITLVVSAGAWILSGDAVRALAVLVVATPCPLILAAPAAIVGGLSHAARRGIIVKGGAALESLAAGQVLLLDKTGTVTSGRPAVSRVHLLGDVDAAEVLRLAGSLDQVSVHPFAPAIVAAAAQRGCELTIPTHVSEELGQGIAGRIDDVEVTVGKLDFVAPRHPRSATLRRLQRRSVLEATSMVYVARAGVLVGALALYDQIRPDTPRALQALRRAGINPILMVTGDRAEVAELVAETVGIDRVLAERAPDEKVDAVRDAEAFGRTIMVGDGINDAPALALADTGVAMGVRGATAASQAADVVLTTDRLEGVAEAVTIARRTRRIAWQSVVVGMGLSVVAMGVAAAGHLPPVIGALLQEGIDVAVIVNALRTLRGPRGRLRLRAAPVAPPDVLADHRHLRQGLEDLAILAERLDEYDPATAVTAVRRTRQFLADELMPHEFEEERTVYPAVAAASNGEDPTAPLVRSHREIARRIRLYSRLVDDVAADGPDAEDVVDLQRALWGLHAVLDLHFILEDDLYDQLPPPERPRR
jgi:heavy metal translocating P-type ATPase